MLSIEDCLEKLDEVNWDPPRVNGSLLEISNTWDRRFVSDLSYHTRHTKPISTAQGGLAIKLIGRYREHLVHMGVSKLELDFLLSNPSYRQPPHESKATPREVRWIGESKLAFRCKYNPIIVEELKKLKGVNHFNQSFFPSFNKEHKIWVVDVNSGNADKAMEIIRRHRFNFDDDVANFFLEVANSKGQDSEATIEEGVIVIKCRDDDFLNAWLEDMLAMEVVDV